MPAADSLYMMRVENGWRIKKFDEPGVVSKEYVAGSPEELANLVTAWAREGASKGE